MIAEKENLRIRIPTLKLLLHGPKNTSYLRLTTNTSHPAYLKYNKRLLSATNAVYLTQLTLIFTLGETHLYHVSIDRSQWYFSSIAESWFVLSNSIVVRYSGGSEDDYVKLAWHPRLTFEWKTG